MGLKRALCPAKNDSPTVSEVRAKTGFSQEDFASFLGVSVGAVRDWEHGRRDPNSAAKILLRLADKHPKILVGLMA